MTKQLGKIAIVMGGGIAGLLAARVLSDFFEKVVVLERDTYPKQCQPRAGVPQSQHIHTLLVRGQQIVERLFPGFDTDLAAMGVPLYTWGKDSRILTTGGYIRQENTGIRARGHSRTMLEWVLRQRTQQLANIHILDGQRITGLAMATNAVTGVQIMDTAHQCQTLSADFVVDAMGRHSRTMMWLAELGYPEPPETVINPFMGYATRWYHLPEGVLLDVPAVLIQPGSQPGLYRGAAAGLLEKRRVVVTLLGMNQDYPPTDEAGFAAFAHGLPDDTIARWLSILEPVTPIFGYRATNRLRHMEQVSHYPERLMLLGDATIALNPIYGQGMTVAALHAELLQHLLQQGSTLDGLARHFHRRLAHTNRIPWLLATGEDRRYPLTEGPKPNLLERLAHQYIDLLFRAAARDTVVAVALLKTMQMIQHPMGLLHPRIILGALLAQRASGKSQSTPDSQWHQAAD